VSWSPGSCDEISRISVSAAVARRVAVTGRSRQGGRHRSADRRPSRREPLGPSRWPGCSSWTPARWWTCLPAANARHRSDSDCTKQTPSPRRIPRSDDHARTLSRCLPRRPTSRRTPPAARPGRPSWPPFGFDPTSAGVSHDAADCPQDAPEKPQMSECRPNVSVPNEGRDHDEQASRQRDFDPPTPSGRCSGCTTRRGWVETSPTR